MDAGNRFFILDALDGDLTNGALKAVLLGAKSSALGLPTARWFVAPPPPRRSTLAAQPWRSR
jgi:hypothetical protein